MTKDGRPTLETVAAAAGVSPATVSKVLNDREDVGAVTRRRVQEMLDRFEYVPPRRSASRNAATSPAVNVTLDNVAPTVALTSPASGAAVAGVVSVLWASARATR